VPRGRRPPTSVREALVGLFVIFFVELFVIFGVELFATDTQRRSTGLSFILVNIVCYFCC
jgi:hypothetical protein